MQADSRNERSQSGRTRRGWAVFAICILSAAIWLSFFSTRRVSTPASGPLHSTESAGDIPTAPQIQLVTANALEAPSPIEAREAATSNVTMVAQLNLPPPIPGNIHGQLVLTPTDPDLLREAVVGFQCLNSSLGFRQQTIETSSWSRSRSIQVEPDGNFEALLVSPGTWRLTCTVPGYHVIEQDVSVTATANDEPVVLETRGAWTLRILLCDDSGQALSAEANAPLREIVGATMPCVRTTDPQLATTGSNSSSNVRFRAKRLASDARGAWFDLTLDADKDVWVGVTVGDTIVASQFVRLGVSETTFNISVDAFSRCTISCEVRVVTGPSKLPVVGALVSIEQPLGKVARQVTDAQGLARIAGLFTSDVRINVHKDEYLAISKSIDLRSFKGQTIEVEVATEYSISGVLVDELNRGIRGRVLAYPADASLTNRFDNLEMAMSEEDGSFVIHGLKLQEYSLVEAYTALRHGDDSDGPAADSAKYATRVDVRKGSVSVVVVRRQPK